MRPCDLPSNCRLGYCAHGTGHLEADGGWWYDGTFVDGMMDGRGRYENDFYIHTGGFKNNEFDGKGGLKCLDGPWYETRFSEGSLIELRSSNYPVETRIKPGQRVGWQGPCE